MKEGEIVLTQLPQTNGILKTRPVLLLRMLPRYSDFLVCGISSKLNKYMEGFDEIIYFEDVDFDKSGVVKESVIRLSFLAVLPGNNIMGSIGKISKKRHHRLLKNLSDYLIKDI